MIPEFKGRWRFLSNFEPPLISISCEACGQTHKVTVEHAFHAAKDLRAEAKHQILTGATPGKAKRMGRTAQLRPDWERVKTDIMRDLVTVKFVPSEVGGTLLLSTGDHELVEGNRWHDTFWGKCYCPIHEGRGANVLGTILMGIRATLERSPGS
jgi:ribA/ribD-fused uncharacterized protein